MEYPSPSSNVLVRLVLTGAGSAVTIAAALAGWLQLSLKSLGGVVQPHHPPRACAAAGRSERLLPMLKAHGERRPGFIPVETQFRRDPVEQTLGIIQSLLPEQRASLACTARRMRVHKSMLKSALRRKGLSFSELRDRLRFQLAADYLSKSNVQIGEIGMLVGFSEESSFYRAFKRWASETPGAYRKRSRDSRETPNQRLEPGQDRGVSPCLAPS